MKYFALALVALFGLLACIQATVVELTDENFGDLINKEDEWLIDFYADWCGFCKRLEPKFQAADRLLDRTEYRHVKLGKINVETNPGLAARFFVSRLPTIVHVKDHEVRVMKPTQKENEIIAFITLEEWREVEPKSGVISPFSLFGKMVGFVGKVVKQLSSHSPWTLIGVLTGFLVFAISLPILFGKPREEDTKKHDTEGEKSSETKKDVIKPQLRERKSKRID